MKPTYQGARMIKTREEERLAQRVPDTFPLRARRVIFRRDRSDKPEPDESEKGATPRRAWWQEDLKRWKRVKSVLKELERNKTPYA